MEPGFQETDCTHTLRVRRLNLLHLSTRIVGRPRFSVKLEDPLTVDGSRPDVDSRCHDTPGPLQGLVTCESGMTCQTCLNDPGGDENSRRSHP